MFSSSNPSLQAVEDILAKSPLGQKYHLAKLTNPLLTFFNYANLDYLRAVVDLVKQSATAFV